MEISSLFQACSMHCVFFLTFKSAYSPRREHRIDELTLLELSICIFKQGYKEGTFNLPASGGYSEAVALTFPLDTSL
jgi:hypothetical protein